VEETLPPQSENALCIPLMVSGTTIGAIQGAAKEADWTVHEIDLVSSVAAQLARHLENLRVLE
jgi:GAF domain-containing protein